MRARPFEEVSVDAAADNELLEGMLTKALIKASDRRAITQSCS